MEFDILFRSKLDFSDRRNPIASSSSEEDYDDHPREPPQEVKEEQKKDEKCQGGVSSSSSSCKGEEAEEVIDKMEVTAERTRTLGGEELELEDDDEGFRTPTSLEHRIPVIQQCPPAPRRPKRKASSSSSSSVSRRQLVFLDVSQEIELLFPLALRPDLNRKIKKIRRGDDDIN
ncbi:cyclin-dependent protein kinase inhibitor SMR3 [Macadamia integrifolia]|uniref:cyclin-dependent protein kinase inhibitor SMR3 n=1 Tax=Macadamia integrifolia TaxID=60698 RepID=UPI001C4F7B68|nr:cyclin-dependent protein kinase inhibitor SMR3 [Macadamia integrifolia]